jgi:hypothetical protein
MVLCKKVPFNRFHNQGEGGKLRAESTYSNQVLRREFEMYVLMRYAAGITLDGLALAAGKDRMRVVARGFSDAIELTRSGSQWLDPDGLSLELDIMMSIEMPFQSGEHTAANSIPMVYSTGR